MSNNKYNYPAIAIAVVVNGLLWALAVWLLLSSSAGARVGGWLFVGAKALMLLTTTIGLICHPAQAWGIFAGRYRFDRRPLRGVGQALTRFVWELPQTGIGYLVTQWRNIFGRVKRVDCLHGIVFATGRNRQPHAYAGVSTGCFVNMWLPNEIKGDFEEFARHCPFDMYRHEFGHTIDSQRWGWFYLPLVGLMSVVSEVVELSGHTRHRHQDFWTERRADRLGERYFDRREHSDGEG